MTLEKQRSTTIKQIKQQLKVNWLNTDFNFEIKVVDHFPLFTLIQGGSIMEQLCCSNKQKVFPLLENV